MCLASGMSMHGLTGTTISMSTGTRSSQVSQVVHRPGWAWESMERGQHMWARPEEVPGFWKLSIFSYHLPVSHGEGGVPLLSETWEVAWMLLLWALSLHLST